MSGHSDLGIFNNVEASSIFTWVLSDTASAARPCAPWQSGYDIHDLCCRHLWCWWSLCSEYCIRSRIIFHNVSSKHNSSSVFLVLLSPIQHSLNDRCLSVRRNELLRPSFLLHRSPLSYFWLSSGSTPKSFPIFSHSLSAAAFAAGIFMAWGHKNKFVYQVVMLQWIVSFPTIWSSWWFGRDSPARSLVDPLASKIHTSLDLI